MKNFTKEVFLLFIGCVTIIFSSNEDSTNWWLLLGGIIITTTGIVLTVKQYKNMKREYDKGDKNGTKDS